MSKLKTGGVPEVFDTERQKYSIMDFLGGVVGLGPEIRPETVEHIHQYCKKKKFSKRTEDEIFEIANSVCYDTFCDTADLPFVKLVFEK